SDPIVARKNSQNPKEPWRPQYSSKDYAERVPQSKPKLRAIGFKRKNPGYRGAAQTLTLTALQTGKPKTRTPLVLINNQ
ncbi:hypothetical protein GBA52_018132, partial [Prunus armeniaca]